jgi:hypothetical protein
LFFLSFPPKYGAHVQVAIKGNILKKPFAISEIAFTYAESAAGKQTIAGDRPWMNATMSWLPTKKKSFFFDLDKKTNTKNITFTPKYKSITINL